MTIADKVFELYPHRPKVAILMSGTGSNAEALLGDEELRDLYDISSLVTDNPQSNARQIGEFYKLPVVEKYTERFDNDEQRKRYFDRLGAALLHKGTEAVFYAGFMKIADSQFCDSFPGLNVHPADLTLIGSDGLPKYRGMKALSLMRQECGYVRSTVHVVESRVDAGPAIALSAPVYPTSAQTDNEVHDMLKAEEHYIFPTTLRLLGKGALTQAQVPITAAQIKGFGYEG